MNSLKISVVVPTKNGGRLFERALAALLDQPDAPRHEILAVDSGSRDGTLQLLQAKPQVRVLQVPPAEFQHGRTRNEAVAQCTGELIAFLTQDALPAPGWLAAWARYMDAHADVAGAFGRQVPQDAADPLEAFDVISHFDSFGPRPRRFLESEPARLGRYVPGAHFFSNVNSCIRRDVLQRLPFPAVEFGEDQAWAMRAQAEGLATGYAPDAVVTHSHDYGTITLMRRRYDEARFMKRTFGHLVTATWRRARELARADGDRYSQHLQRLGRPDAARARRRAWATAIGHYAGGRLAGGEGLLHRWLSLHHERVTEGHR
jgi:rhamnosyltransferase